MRLGGIAAVAMLLSCGGTVAETAAPAGTCSVRLGGAVSAQFDCTLAFVFWGSLEGGTFNLVTANNPSGYVATAFIRLAQEPRAGLSWSSADPASTFGAVAVASGSTVWTIDAAQPAYTLTISNLGVGGGVPGSKAWPSVHGTLTATLVPSLDSIARGSINLAATF